MPFSEIPGCLHDDPSISDDDKLGIEVLTEDESSLHWDTYVSPTSRHFMLLGDSEWPAEIVKQSEVFYRWRDDWNATSPLGFAKKLMSIDVRPNDNVYVFWMREIAVRTAWSTFARNWINFLYEDEGCIVVCEERATALVFSNGQAWLGNRAHA